MSPHEKTCHPLCLDNEIKHNSNQAYGPNSQFVENTKRKEHVKVHPEYTISKIETMGNSISHMTGIHSSTNINKNKAMKGKFLM